MRAGQNQRHGKQLRCVPVSFSGSRFADTTGTVFSQASNDCGRIQVRTDGAAKGANDAWDKLSGTGFYNNLANYLQDSPRAAAALSFEAGFIDNTLKALNPLRHYYHTPEFGAMPGHELAYGAGAVAGTAYGVALQFSMGRIAAGGFGACGSQLQAIAATAAQVYSVGSLILGAADAAVHIYKTGKVDVWDALAILPVLSWGLSKALGGFSCFAAGTLVVSGEVSKGLFSTRAIQDVRQGDEVLTRDQSDPNAPLELKKVVRVFRHVVTELEDVTVRTADGTLETIQTTAEHPFYVDGHGWTGAAHLATGEHLMEDDGREATVVSTKAEEHPEGVAVYNFEVEGDHTYFVEAAGASSAADAVWVHNRCDVPSSLLRNSQGRILTKEYSTYVALRDGKVVCVGISRQALAARLAQHNADGRAFDTLERVIGSITRRQARAVEQRLIETLPNLENEINSIAQNRTWYQDAKNWAKSISKTLDLPS